MSKCGDGLMVEHSLFQARGSGSNPTSPLQFRLVKISFSAVSDIFKQFHYKGGHMGGGHIFLLWSAMRYLFLGWRSNWKAKTRASAQRIRQTKRPRYSSACLRRRRSKIYRIVFPWQNNLVVKEKYRLRQSDYVRRQVSRPHWNNLQGVKLSPCWRDATYQTRLLERSKVSPSQSHN